MRCGLVLATEKKFAVANPHCSKLGAIKRNFNELFRFFADWVVEFRVRYVDSVPMVRHWVSLGCGRRR
jgi:hypothetical protein